jgi:hypothetical protein
MTADEAVPTRKNLRAASGATASRFRKPVIRKSGIDISSKPTKRRMRSRADDRTHIPSTDTINAKWYSAERRRKASCWSVIEPRMLIAAEAMKIRLTKSASASCT